MEKKEEKRNNFSQIIKLFLALISLVTGFFTSIFALNLAAALKQRKRMVLGGLVLLLLSTLALAMPQTFNIHGKLTDSSGTALAGTYNMTFKIYDNFTGGNLIWNMTNKSVTTDSAGVYSVILDNINTTFPASYYLGVTVGGDNEMTPRVNLTSTPYAYRANISESLDSSTDYRVGNLTLGQKITFALGEMIDNIIDGWITLTGSLNVTQNVEIEGNLTVWGAFINLTSGIYYGSGFGLTNISHFYFNKTASTYQGNLSGGSYVGYEAGNYICDQAFSGTHLCQESEIIATISEKNISTINAWTGYCWYSSGGAKYTGANPANDCNGWTNGTTSYLGDFWKFNTTGGGDGAMVNCGESKALCCCKKW